MSLSHRLRRGLSAGFDPAGEIWWGESGEYTFTIPNFANFLDIYLVGGGGGGGGIGGDSNHYGDTGGWTGSDYLDVWGGPGTGGRSSLAMGGSGGHGEGGDVNEWGYDGDGGDGGAGGGPYGGEGGYTPSSGFSIGNDGSPPGGGGSGARGIFTATAGGGGGGGYAYKRYYPGQLMPGTIIDIIVGWGGRGVYWGEVSHRGGDGADGEFYIEWG